MKLATSTGDFSWYTNSVSEEIRSFKDSKFRYINLEQPGSLPAYFAESDDDWKRLADEWGNAAADAGVTFVVSHAPCLRMPGSNHLQPAQRHISVRYTDSAGKPRASDNRRGINE
jgi:hypothetical protein